VSKLPTAKNIDLTAFINTPFLCDDHVPRMTPHIHYIDSDCVVPDGFDVQIHFGGRKTGPVIAPAHTSCKHAGIRMGIEFLRVRDGYKLKLPPSNKLRKS